MLTLLRAATRVATVRFALATLVFTMPSFAASGTPVETSSSARTVEVAAAAGGSALDAASWSAPVRGGIDPELFALALEAAGQAIAHGDAADPRTLTVIDF